MAGGEGPAEGQGRGGGDGVWAESQGSRGGIKTRAPSRRRALETNSQEHYERTTASMNRPAEAREKDMDCEGTTG